MRKGIDFITFLAIVSILGFLVIVVNAFSGIDISPWVNALIFIVIGTSLAIIGNILSFVEYMHGGLTPNEIAHLITALIGLFSIVAGIISLPLDIFSRIPPFTQIKGFIAFFAMIFIAIEAWGVR